MVFAERIQGQEGKVMLSMGALVGYFSHWTLISPDKKTYVFSGTLGYVNGKLWKYGEDNGHERKVTVRIGKDKSYRLCQPEGAPITLDEANKTLTMEKVSLCLPEHGQR